MKKISAQVYDILETRSLVLQVGELDVMTEDASRADVLYLKGLLAALLLDMRLITPAVKDTNTTDRLTKLCSILLTFMIYTSYSIVLIVP